MIQGTDLSFGPTTTKFFRESSETSGCVPVIRHYRLDSIKVVASRLELGSLQATALEAAAEDREEHEPAADDEQNDGHEADALPPPRRARRP